MLVSWRRKRSVPKKYSLVKGDNISDIKARRCCELGIDSAKQAKTHFKMAGIAVATAAGFFMACSSLFVRLGTSLPYYEFLIARSVGILALCPPLLIYNNESVTPTFSKDFCYGITRAILGCSAMAAYYFSFGYIPLVDATTILFTNPVWTTILAYVILHEDWGRFDFAALVFTLAGTILITRPTFLFSRSETVGYTSSLSLTAFATVLVFGASFMESLSYICVRKLEKPRVFVVVFYYGVIGLFIGIGVGICENGLKYPDCGTPDKWYALLCALFAFSGQICLIYALKVEQAATVALGRATDIGFVFILQTVFLHAPVNPYSVTGAVFVLFSNGFIFWKKVKVPGLHSS